MSGAFPPIDDITEAWATYAELKRRADETLLLDDGIAAVQAWKVFLNLFLADDHKVPVSPPCRSNVAIFPVHLARSPQRGVHQP